MYDCTLRCLRRLVLSGALCATAAPAFAQHAPVGTNLVRVDDWTTAFAFLDVFKTSRAWVSLQRAGTPDPRPLDLDARGWVRSLQPGQFATTFLFWDLSRAPGQYPAGRYVVTYEGEGTLAYSGSAVRVDATPGREVIDVDPNRGGGIRIDITATNPANYLRNISVRLSTSSTTDVFDPTFVERVAPYRVLRFKDWQATDGDWTVNGPSQQRRWSDRPVVDDARWSGTHGVPLEIMAALANRTGADAWFSMPHQADDDYVRQFAQLALQLLSPTIKVYVEYSNEVWNGNYAQARYAQTQGLALGLSQNATEAGIRFHSRRSREIFGIWEGVFPRERLVRVLGSFHLNAAVTQTALAYGDTAAHTDAVAVAPYFGFRDAASARGLSLDAIMQRLDTTLLAEAQTATLAQVNVLRNYRLPLIAYEGGQALTAPGDATLTDLFLQANRDPRMGNVYTRFLQDWNSATAGGLLVHFTDCWSAFGSLEYISQPRSQAPKYDALMRWIEQDPNPGVPPGR